MEKKCKLCNKTFTPKTNDVCCSLSCKKENIKLIKKQYKINNFKKVKEYNKLYRCTEERKNYMKEYRKTPENLIKERQSGLRYYKKNKHIERAGSLRRKFNLTIEQYDEMFKTQNGVCAICLEPESKVFPKTKEIVKLAVDHCHATGRIRGLLCWNCNSSLGKFKDSIEILKRAIEYLDNKK